MAIKRQQARDPEGTLGEVIDRLFSEIRSRAELPPPRPVADVFDSPDGTAYIIEVPVPGLTVEELTLNATADTLTLEVQPRRTDEAGRGRYLAQEIRRVPSARVFNFPTPIDPDRTTARIEHGMLRITAPKAEGSPSRRIPVDVAPAR